jgi:hypothetical protein
MQLIAHDRVPATPLAALLLAAFCLLPCPGCNKKSDPAPVAAAPGAGSGGESGRPLSAETAQGSGGASGGGAGGASSPPANSPGVPCGPKTCAAGQICCNASCGICTPPDGVCTQQLCSEPDGGSHPTGPSCKQDSDCRLFSDYCTGCDCRALLKTDKDPLCSGPGVRCLADPCRDHSAVCREGKCAAATAKTPRGP